MLRIVKNFIDFIGNILLLELLNYNRLNNLEVRIIVKLEYFNLVLSVKDRIGYVMIKDVEEKGLINKDIVIIELMSGNMGIVLVFVVVVKGYRLILIMLDIMSIERRKFLKVLGVEFVLILGVEGMRGVVKKVEELVV